MTYEVEAALDRAERALDDSRTLRHTGFWKAVDEARRDPSLAERYADRIATIDRRAFEAGVKARVPLAPGLLALFVITLAGLGLVAVAYRLDPLPQALALLAGTGALLVGTHSPVHYVAGRLAGIRFTHVFLGGPPPPRPGVKTDYASYLRASPRARALMHASAPVVTKVIPFALIGAALAMDAHASVTLILLGLGTLQIVTDAVISTKTSDWKKVRRELRAARYG